MKDREGTLPEDDSRTLKAGDMVRIYYATKDISVNVPISVKTPEGYEDRSQILSNMEMPYPPGLFVKAGDTFSIRINKAVDNYGKDVTCYVVDNGTVYDLSETYTKTMKTTSEFTFETDSPSGGCNGRFYVDIQYDGSGFSEPSGSAALFAGICAAVTIAIFCILAYAGLKPKWSK
jgi:predicted heme/steroid binding protein